MNSDEIGSLIRKLLLTVLSGSTGAQLASKGVDPTTLVTAVGALGTIAWGVYSHWGQKKVPETAKVVK